MEERIVMFWEASNASPSLYILADKVFSPSFFPESEIVLPEISTLSLFKKYTTESVSIFFLLIKETVNASAEVYVCFGFFISSEKLSFFSSEIFPQPASKSTKRVGAKRLDIFITLIIFPQGIY